ncbi:MAG TPA: MBL fold metallo-hydrolase [Ktedonobacteraceae bacterium]|jgi:phosphoribosyl 1,2-cyclic phosphodiesterase
MSDRQQFLVRFWGVRGSYPTPGPQTLRHGGNTACVEIQVGGRRLIFDAGSGIIRLGSELLLNINDAEQLDVALFITHGHGDHLIGFPFFAPLFDARTHIHLFGPQLAGQEVEQLVTSLMSPPYFPVDLRKLPSHRTFHTVTGEEWIVWRKGSSEPHMNGYRRETQDHGRQAKDEVKVRTKFTRSHPLDGAVIYRIEYAGHSVVYATDVEWREGNDPEFLRFVEGADLLIHDAQYTTHDYQQVKQGFGHSTVEMAVEAAQAAHVQELILFHHEPTYDDNQLDAMEAEAQSRFPHVRSACEGMEIDLLEGRSEV